jgi:hypothetical protein
MESETEKIQIEYNPEYVLPEDAESSEQNPVTEQQNDPEEPPKKRKYNSEKANSARKKNLALGRKRKAEKAEAEKLAEKLAEKYHVEEEDDTDEEYQYVPKKKKPQMGSGVIDLLQQQREMMEEKLRSLETEVKALRKQKNRPPTTITNVNLPANPTPAQDPAVKAIKERVLMHF